MCGLHPSRGIQSHYRERSWDNRSWGSKSKHSSSRDHANWYQNEWREEESKSFRGGIYVHEGMQDDGDEVQPEEEPEVWNTPKEESDEEYQEQEHMENDVEEALEPKLEDEGSEEHQETEVPQAPLKKRAVFLPKHLAEQRPWRR